MKLLGWTPQTAIERSLGFLVLLLALLGPAIFSGYFTTAIITQTFIFGIAAASLIFLSAYGGMISLAQTALMGIAGYVVGNVVTKGGAGGETKGLVLGWDPTLALVLAIVITTAIGLVLGAVGSRSSGIYFLMLTLTFGVIANYFFGQVTKLGGFSPSPASTCTRRAGSAPSWAIPTSSTTSPSASRSSSTSSSATS